MQSILNAQRRAKENEKRSGDSGAIGHSLHRAPDAPPVPRSGFALTSIFCGSSVESHHSQGIYTSKNHKSASERCHASQRLVVAGRGSWPSKHETKNKFQSLRQSWCQSHAYCVSSTRLCTAYNTTMDSISSSSSVDLGKLNINLHEMTTTLRIFNRWRSRDSPQRQKGGYQS